MSLRVAFDLDGTLADMQTALTSQAEMLFGADLVRRSEERAANGPPADSAVERDDARTGHLRLTARQQSLLWEHVRTVDNFWNLLPEAEPGIVRRIAELAAARRWEVIFFTTRPPSAGDTTQIQSQRWLRAHGFELPSVFVVQRSRGKIADALHLDAFVDDRPEHCLDVALESMAKPILVWPGDPALAPAHARRLGVRIARSIGEAVSLLQSLDDLRQESRIVRSIKRVLGKD